MPRLTFLLQKQVILCCDIAASSHDSLRDSVIFWTLNNNCSVFAPGLLHYAFYLLELLAFNIEHKGGLDRARELHNFFTDYVLRYAGLQPSNNQDVCEVLYCSVELERVRNFEAYPGRVFKVGFKFLLFFCV